MSGGPAEQPASHRSGWQAWPGDVIRGRAGTTLLVFVLLAGFYLATAAGNISETDDVYAFAYRAENFALGYLSDPRLMLYHVLMRLLFLVSTALGLDVSALVLMRGVSALAAAASLILLLRIVVTDLKLSATTAVLAAATLAATYGFWRYAAEAEVYVPAIFFILLIFHGLMGGVPRLLGAAGWGAVAGLTVLFYQPSVIPLFFAFPWLLLRGVRSGPLCAYLLAGGLVVVGGYLIGFLVFWPEPLGPAAFAGFLSQRAGEFMVPALSLKTVIVSVIRSIFSLGHDIVSVNWIFAFEPVVNLIQRAFSNNVITEEVFLARRAGWLVYPPIATLLVLVVLALVLLPKVWPLPLAALRRHEVLVVLGWLGLNGAVIGRLNPAGLEAWIMVLPPLVMIFALCVIEPCLSRGRGRAVATLVAVLFLHNAIGGMALVFDPENEYDRVKGRWVIAEATPRDLVIVNGNAGLAESLRYLSAARVVLIGRLEVPDVATSLLQDDLAGLFTRTEGRDFNNYFLRDAIAETWQSGGRLIFLDPFFAPPKRPLPVPRPGDAAVKELQTRVMRVFDAAEVGATYVLGAPIR